MKNIHVLETDKPSLLHKAFGETYILSTEPTSVNDLYKSIPQNIYVTSDEKPKAGDWFLIRSTSQIKKFINCNLDKSDKKIILTTDLYLIKDGVQAIDDEFLEWFVQNSSCEFVEVVKESFRCCHSKDIHCSCYDTSDQNSCSLFYADYKIIIPKTTQEIINEYFNGGLTMGQIEKPKKEKLEYGLLQHIKFCLECGNESQAIRLIEKYGFEKQEQNQKEIEDLKNRLITIRVATNNTIEMVESLKTQAEKMYSYEEVLLIDEEYWNWLFENNHPNLFLKSGLNNLKKK